MLAGSTVSIISLLLTNFFQQDILFSLHTASRNGHLAMVGKLLAEKADVQEKDQVFNAALYPACSIKMHFKFQAQYKLAFVQL
jgi:hypothetical protein